MAEGAGRDCTVRRQRLRRRQPSECLAGKIIDGGTGESVEARVQVVGPGGNQLAPTDAMFKVGSGEPFFYSDGEFSLQVPRGRLQITVERGTEFTPWRKTVEAGGNGTVTVDVELQRWSDLPERGWHPGNTHIHYDEKEGDPDRRLAYDSRVEDLRMTAISVLKRWGLEYATNKYPPGMLNQFTDTHHYVQHGEETRHHPLHIAIDWRCRFAKRYRYDCSSRIRTNTG